jgi:hypothetical protein
LRRRKPKQRPFPFAQDSANPVPLFVSMLVPNLDR